MLTIGCDDDNDDDGWVGGAATWWAATRVAAWRVTCGARRTESTGSWCGPRRPAAPGSDTRSSSSSEGHRQGLSNKRAGRGGLMKDRAVAAMMVVVVGGGGRQW